MGGVAFAMVFIILLNERMKKNGTMTPDTEKGILFWSAMYIPVVVAMSSIQNVKAALSGGWVAAIVGLIGTASCFLLVPFISRIGARSRSIHKTEEKI